MNRLSELIFVTCLSQGKRCLIAVPASVAELVACPEYDVNNLLYFFDTRRWWCRDMRALLKKLKVEQSAVDKKEAAMYSKVFQRMAQTSGAKQSKTDQVHLLTPSAL